MGANTPERYGYYYAWGETTTKNNYTNNTYTYYDALYQKYTKYNATDGLTTLQPEDDIATIYCGASAHIPTMDEWQELINNTTWATDTLNGIAGYRFTCSNGNSIFVPCAGYKTSNSTALVGREIYYWSSTQAII